MLWYLTPITSWIHQARLEWDCFLDLSSLPYLGWIGICSCLPRKSHPTAAEERDWGNPHTSEQWPWPVPPTSIYTLAIPERLPSKTSPTWMATLTFLFTMCAHDGILATLSEHQLPPLHGGNHGIFWHSRGHLWISHTKALGTRKQETGKWQLYNFYPPIHAVCPACS